MIKINESGEYGLRWTVAVGRNGRLTTKEKFFNTSKDREKFIDKISDRDDFIRIESTSDPRKNEAIDSHEYDPYKKDLKKDKNGKYTDGWGNGYTLKRNKSDVIKFARGFTFQYDYTKQILTMSYENNKQIRSEYLSLGDWLDGPEYWMEKMYDMYAYTIVV